MRVALLLLVLIVLTSTLAAAKVPDKLFCWSPDSEFPVECNGDDD